MTRRGSVIGWRLDREQREQLLADFPPKYPDRVADHVTLRTDASAEPLPADVKAAIVGHADDGQGVECMVVTVDGTTDRPDGSTFHITWSLDKSKGRKARESNDVIKECGWQSFGELIPVRLEPARF